MAKILILGVGHAQLDLFNVCRVLGFEIVACGNSEDGPGVALADSFSLIDICDIAGVKEVAEKESVDLIYSVGSDFAMPTVCSVSQMLGLPFFVSPEVARLCRVKSNLREFLGKDFAGNVEYQVLRNAEGFQGGQFPLVMKPVDSQGQRGVRTVRTIDDIHRYLESTRAFSRRGEVVVETALFGSEVSVNTYLISGKLVACCISDRLCWQQFDGGLVRKHVIPSKYTGTKVEVKIVDLVSRILAKLGISDGPCYFQVMIISGEPYLIEVSPRFDGCHLWRLISLCSPINLLEFSVRHLAGDYSRPFACKDRPFSSADRRYCLEFFYDYPGSVMESDKFALSNPLFVQWYYENGEIIQPKNGIFEKCGYQIFPVDDAASDELPTTPSVDRVLTGR